MSKSSVSESTNNDKVIAPAKQTSRFIEGTTQSAVAKSQTAPGVKPERQDPPKKGPKRVAKVSKGSAPDPFDPESLRLGQDFGAAAGVKKVLTRVPCRKPHRHEFVQVRPGEDWRIETACFEDKINRDVYLVDRALWSDMAGEVYPVCLFLTVNRQNDVMLWPVKLPGADGRSNTWNDSAMDAARLAETTWVRIVANMGAGMYDAFTAVGELSDPVWPELSFHEILKLAFRDRFIQDPNHPILKALRGES